MVFESLPFICLYLSDSLHLCLINGGDDGDDGGGDDGGDDGGDYQYGGNKKHQIVGLGPIAIGEPSPTGWWNGWGPQATKTVSGVNTVTKTDTDDDWPWWAVPTEASDPSKTDWFPLLTLDKRDAQTIDLLALTQTTDEALTPLFSSWLQ